MKILRAFVMIVVLVGCLPACNTTTEAPLSTVTIISCPQINIIREETWVDRNGNGNCDPEDEPLPDVHFELNWNRAWRNKALTTLDLTTDASGHIYHELGNFCDKDELTIEPETPQDFQLTSRERGICRFEDPSASSTRVTCTSYGFTPTTPSIPADANESQEVPTVSTLDVRFERGEASSATLLVDYDCAFETGEIIVDFRESSEEPGPSITYEPALPIAVPRGSSGVELQATAVSSGTTYWLIVGLRSTTAECQDFSSFSPPFEYEADQIIAGDCAVWKIVPHSRNWFPEIRGGIRRSSERKESDE